MIHVKNHLQISLLILRQFKRINICNNVFNSGLSSEFFKGCKIRGNNAVNF